MEATLKDLSKRCFSRVRWAACVLFASALFLGLAAPVPALAQSAPAPDSKKPRVKAPNQRARRAAEPRVKSAEFDAAALGHRSFLRELAHTRNDAAFR